MNIREFFNRQKWTYSKTYADKAPHEYIVRDKINGTDDEFASAVSFIRENGFKANFWKSQNTYLFLDGRFYWTMGAPIDETVIINRCDMNDYHLAIYPNKKVGEESNGNVL